MLAGLTALLGGGGGGGGSFESIATVTGNGSATTLTFNSIPSTFKHLQIRQLSIASSQSTIWLQLNSDSSANYAWHSLTGNGSSASATGYPDESASHYAGFSGSSSMYGVAINDIHDYSSTSKFKTIRNFCGWDQNGSGQVRLSSGLWRSTSAVTSITIGSGSAFLSGSTFALYGIKG